MQYTGAIDFIYLGKWHPKLKLRPRIAGWQLVHSDCAWILSMYVDIHSQETYWTVYDSFHLQFFFFISCLQSRVQIRWQNRGGDRFRYQRGCQGSGEDGPEKNPNLTNWRWKKQTSKDGDQIVYIFFLLLDVVLYFF